MAISLEIVDSSKKKGIEKKKVVLSLAAPCISESCTEIKIKLNFYFYTSLQYLKRFYEGLKGLHKTFWGTTKKCENKYAKYQHKIMHAITTDI